MARVRTRTGMFPTGPSSQRSQSSSQFPVKHMKLKSVSSHPFQADCVRATIGATHPGFDDHVCLPHPVAQTNRSATPAWTKTIHRMHLSLMCVGIDSMLKKVLSA
mmetsp:Transcript_8763/g.21029  ORF Transcript_8763/g.21029 Transcript_8763/m.21029 type:complete len:105 (-) Transcript_8763:1223-1537(-)